MKRKSKYQRRHQKSRDCTQCQKFLGFISKNYFVCAAEMFEDQESPKCHDIYDRDVLKKGTCNLFVPIEALYLDRNGGKRVLHDNDAMEQQIKEDNQSLPDEE